MSQNIPAIKVDIPTIKYFIFSRINYVLLH